MADKVLRGADVVVYINGQKWTQVQEVRVSNEQGVYGIWGVDDPDPQEIAPAGRRSTRGSIRGLKLRSDGNLQGSKIVPIISNILRAPYISIRVVDRTTKEDIFYWLKAKVSNDSWAFPAKGIVVVSFQFMGLRLFQPLDRLSPTTEIL